MIRETSIETYLEIKREGLLQKREQEVYECIYSHGPMTAGEVFSRLNLQTNQSGRFTSLRNKGVLEEVGKRKCGATGRTAIMWKTTDAVPRRIKKISRRQKKSEAVKMMQSLKSTALLDDSHIMIIDHAIKTINEL